MAGNEVQQEVVDDQAGKPADGSKHIRTLDDLKSKIDQLKDGAATPPPVKPRPQCPRVPWWLRLEFEGSEVSDDHHYEPKIISLGPYHHGKHHLKDGETLKLKFVATYLQWSIEKSVDHIYDIIWGKIKELKKCYGWIGLYSEEEFAVMMLVDGCALLGFLFFVCFGRAHKLLNVRYEDLSRLHQDALLLENQLPYQLLQMLMDIVVPKSKLANEFWTPIFLKFFGMNDKLLFQEFFGDEESFLQKMKNYCCRLFPPINRIISSKSKSKSTEKVLKPCHHLLDLLRRNFLGEEPSSPKATANEDSASVVLPIAPYYQVQSSDPKIMKEVMASFRNVKELMAAGIRIKRSPTRYLRDISFHSNGITACLRIPPITIDNSTKAMFLNLIAYEMTSDVEHDVISYLRFLDSLIDHADDVKELQSIGILQNNLGTHEEVAQFFNTVSAKLEPNFHAYKVVRVRIQEHFQSHYNSKLKMLITECLDTYFGSPWTIIAWIGAALALFFTAVQTYFSVFHH